MSWKQQFNVVISRYLYLFVNNASWTWRINKIQFNFLTIKLLLSLFYKFCDVVFINLWLINHIAAFLYIRVCLFNLKWWVMLCCFRCVHSCFFISFALISWYKYTTYLYHEIGAKPAWSYEGVLHTYILNELAPRSEIVICSS